jgi:hypothetical protein
MAYLTSCKHTCFYENSIAMHKKIMQPMDLKEIVYKDVERIHQAQGRALW